MVEGAKERVVYVEFRLSNMRLVFWVVVWFGFEVGRMMVQVVSWPVAVDIVLAFTYFYHDSVALHPKP